MAGKSDPLSPHHQWGRAFEPAKSHLVRYAHFSKALPTALAVKGESSQEHDPRNNSVWCGIGPAKPSAPSRPCRAAVVLWCCASRPSSSSLKVAHSSPVKSNLDKAVFQNCQWPQRSTLQPWANFLAYASILRVRGWSGVAPRAALSKLNLFFLGSAAWLPLSWTSPNLS